jgi:hypothetical protein
MEVLSTYVRKAVPTATAVKAPVNIGSEPTPMAAVPYRGMGGGGRRTSECDHLDEQIDAKPVSSTATAATGLPCSSRELPRG